LGAWQDAESSDAAAYAASDAWVKRKGLPAALRSYHALAWREYELLQLGRYRDARATLDEIEPGGRDSGQLTLLSDLSTMRARSSAPRGRGKWRSVRRSDCPGRSSGRRSCWPKC